MKKILVMMGIAAWVMPAGAHDIYTGVRGKNQQLCCGAYDCASTIYKEDNQNYYFLTREKHWVKIPEERVTFLPIPGDQDVETPNHAHLCYRDVMSTDTTSDTFSGEGQEIHLYCAFIPPGSL